MYDNLDSLEGNLSVQDASRDFLTETAKWTRFLGILGYIFIGLMLVIAIITLLFTVSGTTPGVSVSDFAIMIVSTLFYGIPCHYLLKFSKQTKDALARNSSTDLNSAFSSLKSVHKFFGIITIIMIAFYGLFSLVAILGVSSGFF